jgi:hypothetical protein
MPKGRDSLLFTIVKKEELSAGVKLFVVKAPLIAKKCQPGQFIILRIDEDGELSPALVRSGPIREAEAGQRRAPADDSLAPAVKPFFRLRLSLSVLDSRRVGRGETGRTCE